LPPSLTNVNFIDELSINERLTDAAFDYNSSTCSNDIKKWSKDSVSHVFDCISEGTSTEISILAMPSSGGVYTTLLPVPAEKVSQLNPNVTVKSTLGYVPYPSLFCAFFWEPGSRHRSF
jgi:hypothetical protein